MIPQHRMGNELLPFRSSSQKMSVSFKNQGHIRNTSGNLENGVAMDNSLHSSSEFDPLTEDISSTQRKSDHIMNILK